MQAGFFVSSLPLCSGARLPLHLLLFESMFAGWGPCFVRNRRIVYGEGVAQTASRRSETLPPRLSGVRLDGMRPSASTVVGDRAKHIRPEQFLPHQFNSSFIGFIHPHLEKTIEAWSRKCAAFFRTRSPSHPADELLTIAFDVCNIFWHLCGRLIVGAGDGYECAQVVPSLPVHSLTEENRF